MKRKKSRQRKNKPAIRFNNTFTISVILFFSLFIGAITLYKFAFLQVSQASDIKNEFKKQIADVPFSSTFRVPILLYHYVEYVRDENDKTRESLNIPPNIFEQQVQTLVNAGYTFITAKELGDVIDRKIRLPKNPVLLTIDDGHWDLDTVILPVLKKYNIKATAYIIPGLIGGSDFLTQEQLQEVIDSGLVDIGAHTVHHTELKNTLLSVAKYEVEKSKEMLEDAFHISVTSFAYPSGSFDQQAINIVRDAGFRIAVSTMPGIEHTRGDRLTLYRIRPGYKTGDTLLNYLKQNTFKAY